MSEAIIVAIITGVLALIGALIPTWTTSKSITRDLQDIKKENNEQSLAILRLTVMSNDMPISERIAAGSTYIKKGGNGDVKAYYKQLVQEHTK